MFRSKVARLPRCHNPTLTVPLVRPVRRLGLFGGVSCVPYASVRIRRRQGKHLLGCAETWAPRRAMRPADLGPLLHDISLDIMPDLAYYT